MLEEGTQAQDPDEQNVDDPNEGIVISVESPEEDGTTAFTPSIKAEDFITDDEPLNEDDMVDGLELEQEECS